MTETKLLVCTDPMLEFLQVKAIDQTLRLRESGGLR